MTSLPPIFIGIFDQTCSEQQRMKNPKLYHATQKSDFFNWLVTFKWLFLSIFHSLILFRMSVGIHESGILWSTGFNGDILTLGNTVYTYVIITVNLKAFLELDSRNIPIHISIWGSMVVWIVLFWGYSHCWPWGIREPNGNLPSSMTYQLEMVAMSPTFWLGILLVPFTTLIIDIGWKYVNNVVNQSETERARIEDNKSRKNMQITSCNASEGTMMVNIEQGTL